MKKLIYSLLFVMLGVILIAPNSLKVQANSINSYNGIKILVVDVDDTNVYTLTIEPDTYLQGTWKIYNEIDNDGFYFETPDNRPIEINDTYIWSDGLGGWLFTGKSELPEDYYFQESLVKDNGSIGLYHSLDILEDEKRAYIHFRIYDIGSSGLNDDILKTSFNKYNSNLDRYRDHFLSDPGTSSYNLEGNKEAKSINAPYGFSNLVIVYNPWFFAGDNDTEDIIYTYHNINAVNVEINPVLDSFSMINTNFKIYDDEDNELFYFDFENYYGELAIYWTNKELANIDEPNYVRTNYDELPSARYNFYIIDEIQLLDELSNSYTLTMILHNIVYKFDVSFPDEVNILDYLKLDGSYNISYTTDGNDRLLYLQPDLTLDPFPVLDSTIDNPASLIPNFITINLSKEIYEVVEKLELSTIVNKEDNKNAFMYFFFPMEIEKILSVDISYDYRLIYLYGLKKDDWETARNIYLWDQESEIKPSYWWLTLGITYFALDWLDTYNIDTIQMINYLDVPDDVKNDYKTLLNGNVNDLHNLSLHKVHLGQFKSVGSTSYDISNSSVIEITYLKDGVIYEVPYDLINQENLDPPEEETPADKIKEKIDNLGGITSILYYVAIGIILIVALGIALKIINFIFVLFGIKRK